MAVWNPQSFDITKINKNTRYEDGNMPNAEAIDAAIEGAAFAQDKAEEAASSAASAELLAAAANNSADRAAHNAKAALDAANEAADSASESKTAATNAQNSASAAANSASQAASDASDAESSASAAQQSASNAESTANNMMAFVTALTDPPDLSEVANIGTPSVSFVANGEYKKFKFSNLKGETGASISDINFVYSSETSAERIYNVETVLADGTTVQSGQVTIPKTSTLPTISEFAEGEQTQPSADLMIGGFFFTEVQ